MSRRPSPHSARRRARGYTAVELLMSLAVLAIGVSGIMAMQRVTIVANRHSKAVATATRIAQAWVGQLQIDATTWNRPSELATEASDLGETIWLTNATSNQTWFRPAWNAARQFGPAFDALGNPVPPERSSSEHVFCTDIRLTPIFPFTTGAGVIRTEVRVFWLRENGQGGPSSEANLCSPTANTPAAVSAASVFAYHFVYTTAAVRQQPLRR